MGYLFLFLLEAAAVFINERFDRETDRVNESYGPFNGGPRVLVRDVTGERALEGAAWITGGLALFLSIGLVLAANQSSVLAVSMGAFFVLALGYTLPLSSRASGHWANATAR